MFVFQVNCPRMMNYQQVKMQRMLFKATETITNIVRNVSAKDMSCCNKHIQRTKKTSCLSSAHCVQIKVKFLQVYFYPQNFVSILTILTHHT